MRKINLFIIPMLLLLLSSCSSKVLLPYEENSACNIGKESGYCGSLSDVYEYIENKEEEGVE